MKKLITLCAAVLAMCGAAHAQKTATVKSPGGRIRMTVRLTGEDFPTYDISYGGMPLIEGARLGFEFDSGTFGRGLRAGRIVRRRGVERYDLLAGKSSHVEDPYNEARIPLLEREAPHRRVDLVVRVFDDGAAFRYEFPEQEGWKSYVMYDELTAFDPAGDPEVLSMYLDSYTTSHEGFYAQRPCSALDEGKLIEMPALFRYDGGVCMALTEAAVRDYAGMYLMREEGALRGKLSPLPGQQREKVRAELPHRTPWRVAMIGPDAGTLIASNILTSLNDPCAVADTSWIRPGKTTFSWWNGCAVPDTTFLAGSNFMTNKYYIDFAARSGIEYHSIYGYAEQPWYTDGNMSFEFPSPTADVTRPVKSLDMQAVCDYAASQGVGIHLWVNWKPLYARIDEAFDLFERWGVRGMMVDFMDRDDQEMIRIQEEILRKAAEHKLFVQFHGSSKPSGLNRTYPNEFTREGTRNYECYKWSKDVGPRLDISIPFTRLLAGATDYHLGGFRAVPEDRFRIRYSNPWVTGTRCHMLGMYVVLESYLGMVCDAPAAYEGQPGFEFVRAVPTVWDRTVVPAAAVGEYVCVARRSGAAWWLGAINGCEEREIAFDADFLGEGVYRAEIYTDDPDAADDPNRLLKRTETLRRGDRIVLRMAAGGGAAIRFVPQEN